MFMYLEDLDSWNTYPVPPEPSIFCLEFDFSRFYFYVTPCTVFIPNVRLYSLTKLHTSRRMVSPIPSYPICLVKNRPVSGILAHEWKRNDLTPRQCTRSTGRHCNVCGSNCLSNGSLGIYPVGFAEQLNLECEYSSQELGLKLMKYQRFSISSSRELSRALLCHSTLRLNPIPAVLVSTLRHLQVEMLISPSTSLENLQLTITN